MKNNNMKMKNMEAAEMSDELLDQAAGGFVGGFLIALTMLDMVNKKEDGAGAVAHGRGVLLCAAERCGIPLYEYTPSQVKLAVTGYGKADKHQVMDMTRRLLKLAAVPKPDDAADALAIALCHARSFTSRLPRSGDVKETV